MRCILFGAVIIDYAFSAMLSGLGLSKERPKVTHFGPNDAEAISNSNRLNAPVKMTRKVIDEQARKDQNIAKKLRREFAD